MKRSDIPDTLVLRLAADSRAEWMAPGCGYKLHELGVPAKLITAKIEHMFGRGLLGYGVHPWGAWPTPAGLEVLTAHDATVDGFEAAEDDE